MQALDVGIPFLSIIYSRRKSRRYDQGFNCARMRR
jgi:hypothetical protein